MTRVTRYIGGQILFVVLFVTAALTLAVWLSQSLRFVDMIINRGLPLGLSLYFLGLMMPSLLALILPVALFIAVLFVFHKMTVDSELVVMRAAGLSPLRIARPALLLAATAVLIGFSLTLYFLPASFRAFKDLQQTIRASYVQVVLQPGVFTEVTEGLTFYARAPGPEGVLRGVLVQDNRTPDRPVTYTAATGALVTRAGRPQVVMEDGTYQELDRRSGELSVLSFDRAAVGLADFLDAPGARSREAKERYLHELFFPADLQDDPLRRNEMRAEGHQRLVTPLYSFTFTIVGLTIVLAGDFQRRGHLVRLGAAVLAIIALQVLSLALQNLTGRLPTAAPAMYLGPLLPAAFALLVLTRPRQPLRRRRRAAPAARVAAAAR